MTNDPVDARPSGRLPGGGHGDGAVRDFQARSIRILHVDDDELNRALVRTALARSAARRQARASGPRASFIRCACTP